MPNCASLERRLVSLLLRRAADDVQRRVGGVERLDLVLVEPADLDAALAVQLPGRDRQGAGDHLGEGGLARPVDAQQADAVVHVQPQVQVAQHRRRVAIADGGVLQPHQRRRQRARRARAGVKGATRSSTDVGDGLQLGQPLDAGLRLGGLAGLGLEAVDEALQVGALGLLLDPGRGLQPRLLRPPPLEVVVAAGVQLQLAVVTCRMQSTELFSSSRSWLMISAECGYFVSRASSHSAPSRSR